MHVEATPVTVHPDPVTESGGPALKVIRPERLQPLAKDAGDHIVAAEVSLAERKDVKKRSAEKVRAVNDAERLIERAVVGVSSAAGGSQLAAAGKVVDLLTKV